MLYDKKNSFVIRVRFEEIRHLWKNACNCDFTMPVNFVWERIHFAVQLVNKRQKSNKPYR